MELVRVTVVVESERGRVQIVGGTTRHRARLSHVNRRLALGDEVHARIEVGTSKLALLGRVCAFDGRANAVDVRPGVSFELEVMLLMKDGSDVSARAFFGGSAPVRPTDDPTVSGVVGNLERMSLVDVVQSLAVTQKTARVELVPKDGTPGCVFVEKGAVVHAAWEELTGEDAFFQLIEVDAGLFRLRFGRASPGRTIGTSTTFLLMEAARRVDEGSRGDEEVTRTQVMPLPLGSTSVLVSSVR